MFNSIKVSRDPAVPIGTCAIMHESEVIYVGRLGKRMVPFLKPDALLILNPYDYADGENFMQKHGWTK